MKTLFTLIAAAILTTSSLTAAHAAASAQTAQRLRFARGADTIERSGTLARGGADRYVIRLGANDDFIVTAAAPNNTVIVVIWGADGTVLISDHADAQHWAGVTPSTQDYFIDVRAIDGTSGPYTLAVTARPIQPSPPHPAVQRIVFRPGAISAAVSGRVVQGAAKNYVLKASGGQRMRISASARQPGVVLSVYGADGTVLLSSMAGSPTFDGTLPSTQDYFISLTTGGRGAFEYSMQVTVEGPVQ